MFVLGLAVYYNNYGNRLQNYAAQQVLESIGYDVTTIVNKPTKEKASRNFCEIIKADGFTELIRKVFRSVNKKNIRRLIERKMSLLKYLPKLTLKSPILSYQMN